MRQWSRFGWSVILTRHCILSCLLTLQMMNQSWIQQQQQRQRPRFQQPYLQQQMQPQNPGQPFQQMAPGHPPQYSRHPPTMQQRSNMLPQQLQQQLQQQQQQSINQADPTMQQYMLQGQVPQQAMIANRSPQQVLSQTRSPQTANNPLAQVRSPQTNANNPLVQVRSPQTNANALAQVRSPNPNHSPRPQSQPAPSPRTHSAQPSPRPVQSMNSPHPVGTDIQMDQTPVLSQNPTAMGHSNKNSLQSPATVGGATTGLTQEESDMTPLDPQDQLSKFVEMLWLSWCIRCVCFYLNHKAKYEMNNLCTKKNRFKLWTQRLFLYKDCPSVWPAHEQTVGCPDDGQKSANLVQNMYCFPECNFMTLLFYISIFIPCIFLWNLKDKSYTCIIDIKKIREFYLYSSILL